MKEEKTVESTSTANNRRIAKNTGMLYIRMMLTMFVSLYTSRIVLKILGVEDFGINNVVGGAVLMFSFLNGALGAANARFMAFEIGRKDKRQLKKVYRTAFTIQVLMAVTILIALETAGIWLINYKLVIPPERLYAANWIFQFATLSATISVLQVPLTASIIAHERMAIYAYLGVFDVVMKLLVVFLLYISVFDKLITYGLLLLIVVGLLYVFYVFYCKKNFEEYSIRILFNKSLFKKMLSYSGWSFIGSFSNIMKLQGNNILINLFFGPGVNAARGIAYQVNFAVSSFTQNFTTAINPQIIKNYASGEIDTMMELLFRGAKFSYFMLLLLGLPIILETEFILNMWLVDVPEYAVIFTQLIIINSLVESFAYVISSSIQATGRVKWYQIIIGGFLLLNLPISYLLLKIGYPPEATLYISITLACIAILFRTVIVKNLIPQFRIGSFFSKVYLIAFIVTVISIIPPWLIKQQFNTGWLRFILVSFSSVIVTFIAIWIVGLAKIEKDFIKGSISSFFIKKK